MLPDLVGGWHDGIKPRSSAALAAMRGKEPRRPAAVLRVNVRVGDGDTAQWINATVRSTQRNRCHKQLCDGRGLPRGPLTLDEWSGQTRKRHGLSIIHGIAASRRSVASAQTRERPVAPDPASANSTETISTTTSRLAAPCTPANPTSLRIGQLIPMLSSDQQRKLVRHPGAQSTLTSAVLTSIRLAESPRPDSACPDRPSRPLGCHLPNTSLAGSSAALYGRDPHLRRANGLFPGHAGAGGILFMSAGVDHTSHS